MSSEACFTVVLVTLFCAGVWGAAWLSRFLDLRQRARDEAQRLRCEEFERNNARVYCGGCGHNFGWFPRCAISTLKLKCPRCPSENEQIDELCRGIDEHAKDVGSIAPAPPGSTFAEQVGAPVRVHEMADGTVYSSLSLRQINWALELWQVRGGMAVSLWDGLSHETTKGFLGWPLSPEAAEFELARSDFGAPRIGDTFKVEGMAGAPYAVFSSVAVQTPYGMADGMIVLGRAGDEPVSAHEAIRQAIYIADPECPGLTSEEAISSLRKHGFEIVPIHPTPEMLAAAGQANPLYQQAFLEQWAEILKAARSES